jgi:hypothetical protein
MCTYLNVLIINILKYNSTQVHIKSGFFKKKQIILFFQYSYKIVVVLNVYLCTKKSKFIFQSFRIEHKKTTFISGLISCVCLMLIF